MTCPGGCIAGGGQPIGTNRAGRAERMQALYEIDAREAVRTSHRNEAVQRLYDEFLGEPLGERAMSCCTRTTMPRRCWCRTGARQSRGPYARLSPRSAPRSQSFLVR